MTVKHERSNIADSELKGVYGPIQQILGDRSSIEFDLGINI